jgi:hypothetical protein
VSRSNPRRNGRLLTGAALPESFSQLTGRTERGLHVAKPAGWGWFLPIRHNSDGSVSLGFGLGWVNYRFDAGAGFYRCVSPPETRQIAARPAELPPLAPVCEPAPRNFGRPLQLRLL